MAGFACGFGAILFVTCEADGHRYDAADFGHGCHFADLAVAGFTFYSGSEMGAMRPGDTGENFVYADPGNGLIGFGIFDEFLDGGFVFGDGDVALHAFGAVRESHEFAGLRIDVTVFAGESEG